MKSRITLLLAIILCLSLLTACGATTQNSQSQNNGNNNAVSKEILAEQKKNLEAGESYRSQGNYQNAINAFKNAGDDAKNILKETILEYAAKANSHEYEAAAGYLAENIPDIISAEEGYPVLEELLNKWSVEEADFKLEDLDVFDREDKLKEFNAAYKIIVAYAETMHADGYDVTELLNDLYLSWGNHATSIKERLEIWARAGEGTDLYTITQAVELLQKDQLVAGAELLTQVVTDENTANYLYNYATEGYWSVEPKSSNEKFERRYESIRAREILNAIEISPEEEAAQPKEPVDLNQFLNDVVVLVGIDEIEGNMPMTDAERQDIETLCGTEPNGKMLILHKRQYYNSDEYTTDINLYHMDMMPDEFYPNSMKEVEFVVLMETTYTLTGRSYTGGTKEIKETTKLTLYDAVTGEKLYTASAKSTPTTYLYYSGTAPLYHSGQSPEMNDAMLQVMQKIRSLKRNK